MNIDPKIQYARITAADGYSTVLPLESLAQSLLATSMNGAPLPREHGYPARLIAPGLHGYKMPKWVERIELTESPNGGFWETRGWSLDGTASIKTAITSYKQLDNGMIMLEGIAYAGSRPVTAVQISINGGDWMPIAFVQNEPNTLARWQISWTPQETGDYHVIARASDGFGEDQHSLTVRIR